MKFKQYRQQHKLRQEDVAARLGIPVRTYQNYEREISEPDSDVLCALADLYGITLDELVGRDMATPKPSYRMQDELVEVFNSLDDSGKRLLLAIAYDVKTMHGSTS